MRHLTAAVREFTRALVNPYDLDELLSRLTIHATDALDAAGAGIMLAAEDGQLAFAAASSDRVLRAELKQDRIQSGACHEAFVRGEPVVVDDIRAIDRWPEYTETILDLGLAAVIGVPLEAHGQTVGVMNVYRETPGPWTEEDRDSCQILAAMGAAYILHANQLAETREVASQLERALASRGMIERAKGIVMERAQVDADTAFELIRKRSMDQNRKLRDIAQDIVDDHLPT